MWKVIESLTVVKEEDEEGQVNDDEISEVKDIEMETDQVSESEPEKEEPRRVSFQDFMRQLSSTSAAPPAIPSPIAEDVQEQGETSSAISLTAIDEVFVKAEQSPEDIEVDSSPVAELKKPVPARISLNSDAIRALASSLPLMSAPVISKSEAASPFDPRVFNNSLNADTKVVTQNLEPPTSAPLVESSSSEIIPQRVALPLDLPQAPETSGPISRMTDEFRGVVEYPRAPSYERVWKEERLNRERRESDPSYPLYNRDREFDSPMERTSSVRESFPPPGNRGPREFRNQTWSDPRANDEMLEEPLGGPPRGRIGRESFGREMPREFSRDLQRDRDLPVRDGPPGYPRRDYYQPPMRGRGRGGYEGRGGFYRGPDGHGPPFERYAPRDGVPPREGPPYPRREYYPHPMRGRGRRGR